MPIIRKDIAWLAAKVGNEIVMMNADKGNYLGLSEIGARIWHLIDTSRDLDDLCARLVTEYEVTPEVCRLEVEHFLSELAKQGVVSLDPEKSQ